MEMVQERRVRQCPRCGFNDFYRLADGRKRCRKCRHRFTPQTVRAAVRLPERVRQRLLEGFVEGISVYRQQAKVNASRPTIERFQRLLRGCIALEQERRGYCVLGRDGIRLLPVDAPAPERPWWLLGEAVVFEILAADEGQVKLRPADNGHWQQFIDEQCFTPLSDSVCYPLGKGHGLVVLYANNGQVVFRKPDEAGDRHTLPARFWSFARLHLWRYRRVPLRYLHLHLAEVTVRFNDGTACLSRQLHELLDSLSRDEVERIIRRVE